MIDLDQPVLIPLPALLKLCNPLQNSPWRAGEVPRKLVALCLATKRLRAEPLADRTTHVREHAARIAWFVANGWNDPIEIDVGVPSQGCHVAWPILDGNHRLAAAAYLKKSHILANVSGEVEHAEKVLNLPSLAPKTRLRV